MAKKKKKAAGMSLKAHAPKDDGKMKTGKPTPVYQKPAAMAPRKCYSGDKLKGKMPKECC